MKKISLGGTHSEKFTIIDEFEEELYITEFAAWVGRNIVGFVHNISKSPKIVKKPLHEWISWFLDWSEYSDYHKVGQSG